MIQIPNASPSNMRVYLAGGFHSGWQDEVKAQVSGVEFLDPRNHKLQSSAEYTAWDLNAISEYDWLFAFLESSNPSGYALALEIGFAKACAKKILLVDEKSPTNEVLARHLAMLHACADVSLPTLNAAVAFLKTF